MKKSIQILAVSLMFASMAILAACKTKQKQTEMSLETQMEKVSYSLGVNVANNFKTNGLDSLNLDAFHLALKDVFADGELRISEEEGETILQEYFTAKQEREINANKADGQKFLDENKTKEGVVALPSGLQYKVITPGTGKSPKATDQVTTHYEGKLINGKIFDSSYKRGEPATFPVNGVIAGWTEALQLMKEGAKWELYIPSDLAYGERGAGRDIGPNETLIFTVELIKVN